MPPDPLRDLDDDALVARAVAGEQSAFGELVRRHQRAALRVAAVISGSTEEARDIVQDAMIRVHGAIGTYRGSGSVRSWMLRVVANHAKNHVRGRSRRRRRDQLQVARHVAVTSDAETNAMDRADAQRLADALSRLAEPDRAVLGCRFVADLSVVETAEVLHIATGTVKSRTARALDRLRHELDEAAVRS